MELFFSNPFVIDVIRRDQCAIVRTDFEVAATEASVINSSVISIRWLPMTVEKWYHNENSEDLKLDSVIMMRGLNDK